MKKQARNRIWLFTFLALGGLGAYLYFDLRDFLGLTTLSVGTAESRWGSKQFSAKTFKNGSPVERASEVADLIRSNRYVGEKMESVILELGPHDAYHNTDEIPAYSLPEINGDSWTLVFLPDDIGVVRRIIIHKECCYRGIFNRFFR